MPKLLNKYHIEWVQKSNADTIKFNAKISI